jgi:hypothetical protein
VGAAGSRDFFLEKLSVPTCELPFSMKKNVGSLRHHSDIMSKAIIYYGVPPNNPRQHVSENLRLQGINLIKAEPSSIAPIGIRTLFNPSYDNYVDNIATAMYVAHSKVPRPLCSDSLFIMDRQKVNLAVMPAMQVIWDYQGVVPAMTETTLEGIRKRFDCTEINTRGIPAFLATINFTQLAGLISTGANQTTPTTAGNLNIAAALAYVKLNRLACSFLRTHQYPLVPSKGKTASIFDTAFQISESACETIEV